jgi:hypothetical protein
MEKVTNNQREEQIKPWQWKKGQSGNIAGRPKGKSMKEFAREYLNRMTEEERDTFMEGMDKETIWKMAEGNPEQKNENTGEIRIIVSKESAKANDINTEPISDTDGQPQV